MYRALDSEVTVDALSPGSAHTPGGRRIAQKAQDCIGKTRLVTGRHLKTRAVLRNNIGHCAVGIGDYRFAHGHGLHIYKAKSLGGARTDKYIHGFEGRPYVAHLTCPVDAIVQTQLGAQLLQTCLVIVFHVKGVSSDDEEAAVWLAPCNTSRHTQKHILTLKRARSSYHANDLSVDGKIESLTEIGSAVCGELSWREV